jgi:phospholipid/cholesterol/gamma-HCH transport system substrate-binding protein
MINPQIKVGFLVLAALAAAGIVILTLGDVSLKKGYEFYILFDDLADLPPQSIVKVSGVDVGRVSRVRLHKGRARVKIWVEQDVEIFADTKARITKMGMIGNTYLGLTRGTPKHRRIKHGDIIEGINPLSYEQVVESLVTGVSEAAEFFKKIGVKKELAENINQTFVNLNEASRGINAAIGTGGDKIRKTIQNFNSVMSDIDALLKKEIREVNESIRKIAGAGEELNRLLKGIRQGKGVAGKLLTDEEYAQKAGETIDSIYKASLDLKHAVNRVKGFDTSWDAEVYFDADDDEFRTNSGMTFLTSSERFLSVGVENIRPPENREDPGTDRENSLTLKAGKKFGSFGVFGGAIRSSGGIGADWSLKDRLIVETEILEFTRQNPWWNLNSRLKLTEFLSIGLAWENMLDDANLRTGLELEID